MKKIFICSPLKGSPDCPEGRLQSSQIVPGHIHLARTLCKAVVSDIVIPIAPHLYFPQFLDDSNPIQREVGCMFSLALLRECDGVVVYDGCCGISDGMKAEIEEADKLGIKVAYLCSLHELEIKGALMHLIIH